MSDHPAVELAKGLARAHKRRLALIEPAIVLFEEARSEETRLATAENLREATNHADIEFNQAMNRASDRITLERAAEKLGLVRGGAS